jgi:hypothetical protein
MLLRWDTKITLGKSQFIMEVHEVDWGNALLILGVHPIVNMSYTC